MAFGFQALRQKQPKENMKTSKVIAGLLPCVSLLSAAWVLAASDVEDKLTKSFEAKPGGKLVVEADRGSIEVKSADANQVEIEVFRKVSRESQAKAEEILKNHEVKFSLDGNKVQVHAEFKRGLTDGGWRDKGRNLQVRYQILVPKQFNVNLKTAGGSIKVADLIGEARGQTAGGSLSFGQMDGPIYGRTSGGGISVAGCKGGVDLETSGGSIHLGEVQGDTTAHTSGGSISLKKTNGKTAVGTSGGGIEAADVRGSIDASTAGGSITANISAQPTGDCRLHTSGGSIKVSLAEKVAVDVDAKTSGGRVVTEVPVAGVVQGEHKPNVLRGKINGGGPALSLETSGGSIYLQKR